MKKLKLNEIEPQDHGSVLRGSKTNVSTRAKHLREPFSLTDCPRLQNVTNVRKLINERMNLLREAQKRAGRRRKTG